jgi:hypothetical protein
VDKDVSLSREITGKTISKHEKDIEKEGGSRHWTISARLNTADPLLHSEGCSSVHHLYLVQTIIFALLVQPPISPRDLVSNQERVHIIASVEIKRPKARTRKHHGLLNASTVKERTRCGLGVLHGILREPP